MMNYMELRIDWEPFVMRGVVDGRINGDSKDRSN